MAAFIEPLQAQLFRNCSLPVRVKPAPIVSGTQYYQCTYKSNHQQLYFKCPDATGEELKGTR